MSTFWPTAAAACCVARSLGRSSRSRYGIPFAMAPDETSTTSVPRLWAAARASTIGLILWALSPLIEEDPTLTTTRRASGRSLRSRALTRRPRGRGGARGRAGAEQLDLDAQLLEAVTQVADGLLVLEVGLLHPLERLVAQDAVD